MTIERITLFHSNDIHSCFDYWSQMVSYIKRNRDENTLYLELGDHADRSNPLTEATLGKGNVRLLNEAEVDYATIGNNEGITFAKDQLEALYDQAAFPVLLANLFHPNGVRPSWVKHSFVHTMENGLKVGMIGLTAPFNDFYEQLGWVIAPPKEILCELLPDLQKHADVVVLLSHLGLFRDEEIAAEFEGIDVILGAHTHHVLPKGKRILGTLIAQAGKHGAYLGEISIDYDTVNKQVVQSEAMLLDVKEGPMDESTNHLLTIMNEEANRIMEKRVATIPRRLPVIWQEETEVVQLLCDAVTEWCDQEIGMMNAGVLLDSIEKGSITKRDIHRICPHPINPCVVRLTGDQLEKTIERAFTEEMRMLELKGFGFRGKVLGRMIFTGIKVELGRGKLIERITILGKKLEKDHIYSLATLDMYTFGHLFPAVSDSVEKDYFMPEFLRDVLAWKLGQLWP